MTSPSLRPSRAVSLEGPGPSLLGAARSWLTPLFPPAAPANLPAPVVALGYVLGTAVLALLALSRQSGLAATRTMWAEDGSVFYSQAVGRPFWSALVTSYNGYEQLVPRLGAELARLVPVLDAPVVAAWGGALGLAVLALAVFHMARGHLPSAAARGVLVLCMVLLPVAVVEMLDNFVNLPWWMFFASFWALLWRPRGRAGASGVFVLCGLAAASEPLVALLAPLAVARLVALPRLRDNWAVAGLVAGLVLQGLVVLGAPGPHGLPATGLASTVPAFFLRVGAGWLGGLDGTDVLAGASRLLGELVGALLLGALLATVLVGGGRQARRLGLTVAVLAPLCFVVPSWLRGVGPQMQQATSVGFAGRYAATSVLMVLSVLLSAACGPGQRLFAGRGGRARPAHRRGTGPAVPPLAVLVCCLALLPAWVVDFRDWNGRAGGPSWASQVELARSACARPGAATAYLAIDPPGQVVALPCRLLRAPLLRAPGRGPRAPRPGS